MARRKEPYPILKCSLEHLQTATSPALTPTSEVACYSTELNPGQNPVSTQPEGQSSSVSENQRYLVQGAYSRALCTDDKANLKCRGTMEPPFNLGNGYGTQTEKKLENEFLSLLLECLVQNNLVGQSEFVASRKVLAHISSTPHDAQKPEKYDSGVLVVVQKIGGVYYMIERATPKAEAEEKSAHKTSKKLWYWGMKFESYMTANSAQDVEVPMDYNREFCTVVKKQLGAHSIILRGEIDCCQSDGSYVELKTNKDVHWKTVFPDKLMNWWLQSSLVGVENIICGFRDDRGVVKSLHTYTVAQLQVMIPKGSSDVCVRSLDQFLSFVKANVKVDFVPHVIERAPSSSTFKMRKDEKGEYKFIPRWFAEHAQLKTV